jgi:4-amino-4-deoxy-L-arabinose transferase-like glycosyltransferase
MSEQVAMASNSNTTIRNDVGALAGRRLRAVTTALLVLGTFAAFVTVQRSAIASYDGKMMTSVARNLLEHGSLKTTGDFYGFNTPYSTYGIGTSLAVLPLMAIQLLLHPNGAGWITLLNPIVLALTAGVLFRLGLDLGWRAWVSVINAICFALVTMAVWQSIEVLSEPGVTLCTVTALWGCVRWQRQRRGGPVLVGCSVGVAILFRTDAIVLVGLIGACLPLFVPWRRLLEDKRALITVGAPVAGALLWLAFYNWLRWGSITELGYTGYGFTTPLTVGFKRIMLQPGKGFFFYDPLLIAAIPGLVFLWKRNRAVTFTIVLLCIVRIYFYSRWTSPDGGLAWGPRLLFPMCGLLAIPVGQFLEEVAAAKGVWRRVGAGVIAGLIGISALLSVASVWVPYEQYWNRITAQAPGETPADVAQRVDAYFTSYRHGAITGNIRLLPHSAIFPLEHWRDGPTPVGVGSLLVAIASLGGAVFLGAAASRGATARTRTEMTGRVRQEPETEAVELRPADTLAGG